MASYQPKIPIAFTSLDGTSPTSATTIVTFPRGQYEWDSDQPLIAPTAGVPGSDYEFDLLGTGLSIKGPATEALRFTYRETAPGTVDTDTDAVSAAIKAIGKGNLWAQDASGTNRWAYARALAMPSFRWKAGDIFRKAASITFRRDSNWYSDTAYDTTFTINADPKTITVVNPGNTPATAAILYLAGTFTNPDINNNSLTYDGSDDYEITLTDTGASSADIWKVDAGANASYKSTDTGATYNGNFANVTLPAGQLRMFVIGPGSNTIVVSGANGSTLRVFFYPEYD